MLWLLLVDMLDQTKATLQMFKRYFISLILPLCVYSSYIFNRSESLNVIAVNVLVGLSFIQCTVILIYHTFTFVGPCNKALTTSVKTIWQKTCINFSPKGDLDNFGYVIQWKYCFLMTPNSAFWRWVAITYCEYVRMHIVLQYW